MSQSQSIPAAGSKFIKLIVSLFFASAMALTLLLVMYLLIYSAEPNIDEEPSKRIADIFLGERTITSVIDDRARPRPKEHERQPDQPPPQQIAQVKASANLVNMHANFKPTIDISNKLSGEGEYLPIYKIAPIYPRRALQRGIEGHCTVGYTVTTTGAVRDPYIVDCPNPIFRNASLRASLKFKYKPRVIQGEAVEVPGVQNLFTYELTK